MNLACCLTVGAKPYWNATMLALTDLCDTDLRDCEALESGLLQNKFTGPILVFQSHEHLGLNSLGKIPPAW